MDFTRTIVGWYERNKRELPWRGAADPYKVWVSEIILQQTRVEQGMDYYLRFVERFPDVRSLAEATEDEVLRLWQGLGYYSRARNMHAAAKSMAGHFPDTYEGVRALRGVGDYTAAAICSMAYGMPYAAVDGNVYRVLARYFGVNTPIDSSAGKKVFAALAQELLDKDAPGVFNQAVMDFGATLCVPVSPCCDGCPLAGGCVAAGTRMVEKLPVKKGKTKSRTRFLIYIVALAGDRVFLRRREANDIWRGLYEFPCVETDKPLEGMDALRAFAEFAPILVSDTRLRLLKKNVRHLLSHQVLHLDFYLAEMPGDVCLDSFVAVPVDDVMDYALPVPLRAVADTVLPG